MLILHSSYFQSHVYNFYIISVFWLINTYDYKYLIDKCVEEVCVKRVCDRTIDLSVSLLLKATPIENDCSSTIIDDSGIDCNAAIGFTTFSKKQRCTDNPDIKGICPVSKVVALLNDEGKEWTEISIPELLTIPCDKPDIKQIVSVNSRVEIMCQTVVYTADNCEQSLHSINFKFPFCNYIVLPKDVNIENAKFCVEACIENVYAKALNQRTIFKSVTLFLLAVEVPPICPATKQIGGEITNSNKTSDATITLYDGTVAIDSQQYTVPKSGGKQKYNFKALCAKDYTVKFVVPTGFTVSPAQLSYLASELPVTNANATIS